jgi:putative ABC transport system permease protein
VGVVAGLVPSVQARVGNLGLTLKARRQDGARRAPKLRSGLLVIQASLSVILLASAGLFVRSLVKIAAFLEYDVDQVAWVTRASLVSTAIDPQSLRSLATLLAEQPGVTGVALAAEAPMGGSYSAALVRLPNGDSLPEFRQATRGFTVGPAFFDVTGRRIVRGRSFLEGEADVLVMNEFASRSYFPKGDALGQCLPTYGIDAPCARVVGIVADAPWSQITDKPTLQFYRPLSARSRPSTVLLRVDKRAWPRVAALARAELEPEYGKGVFAFERMAEHLDPQLRPWRIGSNLFTTFGLLALLVTLVGVYSVTAYVVSQRTHEIGIRIALGARVRDVLHETVRGGITLVTLGALLGLGAVLALAKVITPLLFGVDAHDPLILGAAATTLVLAGLGANLVPAWRAARVDPVKALAVE